MTTDRTPHTLTVGDLAYLDSFGGMVPVKVLGFNQDPHTGSWSVFTRVTAPRDGYDKGEGITMAAGYVIPRKSVKVRNGKNTTLNDWHLIADGNRVDIFA